MQKGIWKEYVLVHGVYISLHRIQNPEYLMSLSSIPNIDSDNGLHLHDFVKWGYTVMYIWTQENDKIWNEKYKPDDFCANYIFSYIAKINKC